MALKPISQKQFVVTLASTAGSTSGITFNKMSNAKTTYSTFDMADPTKGTISTYPSFAKCDNVTLTKPYEPENGDPLLTWFESYRTANPAPEVSVTIQPVLADVAGTPYPNGKPFTLTGCKVISITSVPAVDRDAEGGAMLELEIAVGEIKHG